MAEEPPAPPTPTFLDEKIAVDRIQAIVANARTVWFALIAFLAFIGLTLTSVRDLDFFSADATTQLPIVNIAIPTTTFFWSAAWLAAILHTYFHLYLLKLWDVLAEAPPTIGGAPLGDRVFPWVVIDWALRQRPDRPTTHRPMDWLARTVVWLIIWLATPLMLAAFWLRSMPAHDALMTLAIGAALLLSLFATLCGWRRARLRLSKPGRRPSTSWQADVVPRFWRRGIAALAATLAVVSLLRTQVGDIKLGPFEAKALWLAPIDLRDADIVRRPADWVARDTAERRFKIIWCRDRQLPADACERPMEPYHTAARATWCGGRAIEDCPAEFRRLEDAFAHEWQEQRGEYLANLARPNLSRRDLRRADASGAFLANINLTLARLEGADLSEAQLERANLHGAWLQGTDLRGARLEGAYLSRAQLGGANLNGARLHGGNLNWARLEGANLLVAQLQSTYWAGATFAASPAHSANFTGGRYLTQGQLAQVIGDENTILPLDADTGEQLHVWTCWTEPPPTLDGLLRYLHPVAAADLRAEWLCDERRYPRPEGDQPRRTGRPAAPLPPDD